VQVSALVLTFLMSIGEKAFRDSDLHQRERARRQQVR
jgi:hypothetical protein